MKVNYTVKDWSWCPKCMTRTVKCEHKKVKHGKSSPDKPLRNAFDSIPGRTSSVHSVED
jgi:hypothetical protein